MRAVSGGPGPLVGHMQWWLGVQTPPVQIAALQSSSEKHLNGFGSASLLAPRDNEVATFVYNYTY